MTDIKELTINDNMRMTNYVEKYLAKEKQANDFYIKSIYKVMPPNDFDGEVNF